MEKVWMVRAGRSGVFAGDFLTRKMTAIGWGIVGDLRDVHSREHISELVGKAFPEYSRPQRAVAAGQIFRFREELVKGSTVLMYEPANRLYRIGTVRGDYAFDSSADEELQHKKAVEWTGAISRDVLTAATKNSLGSIATIFCISDDAAREILAGAAGHLPAAIEEQLNSEIPAFDVSAIGEADIRRDIEQRALEFLQDRIVQLQWDEMQELVAGILRAMGYKTQVAAAGADRGRDITASPDGFGFQEPRIMVEVKHRKGTIGAPDVRAFIGGLRQKDNGLYVSTGGFTREARYEAERANHHLALLDLDGLGKSVMEHYDAMDAETRALLPLKKIYWPA